MIKLYLNVVNNNLYIVNPWGSVEVYNISGWKVSMYTKYEVLHTLRHDFEYLGSL